MTGFHRYEIPAESSELTESEAKMLQAIADGLRREDVASELSLAMGTVKNYRSRIIVKLGAENMVNAVAKGIRRKLII